MFIIVAFIYLGGTIVFKPRQAPNQKYINTNITNLSSNLVIHTISSPLVAAVNQRCSSAL